MCFILLKTNLFYNIKYRNIYKNSKKTKKTKILFFSNIFANLEIFINYVLPNYINMHNKDDYIIISGEKDKSLAKIISQSTNVQLGDLDIKTINGSEIIVKLNSYINNKNIFLIYNICQPVNESIMQILNIADILKKNGAKEINLVSPYLPYTKSPVNLDYFSNTNLLARLIEECQISSIYTFDLYSKLIISAFRIPIYNVSINRLFSNILDSFSKKKVSIVTADYELEGKANTIAKEMNCEFINIVNKTKKENFDFKLDQSVNNKEILIISNTIDTGKTLINLANFLTLKGAKKISIIATHGLFSEDAILRIEKSVINQIYVATAPKQKISSKIKVINKSRILIELIERTIENKNIFNFIK
jgi:ribose-phosphate pyrophosphokinase